MPQILHILTSATDPLTEKVIALQSEQPQVETQMVDLTRKEPDYQDLLARIFAADSVQVW
jgi:hypothetical protein